jgi:hypothetical protein
LRDSLRTIEEARALLAELEHALPHLYHAGRELPRRGAFERITVGGYSDSTAATALDERRQKYAQAWQFAARKLELAAAALRTAAVEARNGWGAVAPAEDARLLDLAVAGRPTPPEPCQVCGDAPRAASRTVCRGCQSFKGRQGRYPTDAELAAKRRSRALRGDRTRSVVADYTAELDLLEAQELRTFGRRDTSSNAKDY